MAARLVSKKKAAIKEFLDEEEADRISKRLDAYDDFGNVCFTTIALMVFYYSIVF